MTRKLLFIGGVATVLAMTAAVTAFGANGSPAAPSVPQSSSAVQEPEGEPGKGAKRNAEAIAEKFGVSADQVLQHKKDGLGFGALFKVYQLARAKGVSPESLIATFPRVNGEIEPGFGPLFAGLTDAEQDQLDDGPKNFGQLKSKGKKR